jgi:hypothetical protein
VSCRLLTAMSPNKQLQRTVIPHRWRAASASFHYAHAARWTAQRAAAELRRYADADALPGCLPIGANSQTER